MAASGEREAAPDTVLTAYVPRLTLEWALEAPGASARQIEGSMAFVDVSGFTRMSERLARLGKAGAEEVNAVMNATFAALLEVAYANGGSLLKFGGDALLLFFTGDDHAARAASAAWGMRATLRRVGRPETQAGRVQLRMHVGIHSGAFFFSLVGEAHRELIVTGSAATHTTAMESTAEAGEIAVSAATAALLPPATVGEPKGEGFLLRADPRAEPRFEPLPDVSALDVERFVPGAVRGLLAAGAVEPEHRQAAVGFLHFGGVDALEEAEGPDAVAAAVAEVVLAAQRAADEHGVCFLESDIDRDGGKIVLVSGAPAATENDEERLLRTARAVVEAGCGLPVRLGVNRGRVFAGEVGAPFRKTYTILGETAALAARLMARAAPGQVLTTADTLERSRTRFETTELDAFLPKGRSEPVVPLAVGPVAGTRERERQVLPLVDRQRELAVLSAAVAPARMGFGTLVEIVGDAGIGKSRIVEEVRRRAGEMAPLTAACEQYESSTPYFVFRELLRTLLDVELDGRPAANSERLRERLEAVAPELVPWIPLLAIPLDVVVAPTREVDELQPAFRRARLHGVVGSLLDRLLVEPTLLLFEDVHWMDEASSELLRHVAAQVLAGHAWLACVTRRPVGGGFSAAEGTPPVPAMTIRLDPLPAEDAKALCVAVAREQLLEHDVDAITERAGGNPLFIQELVAASAHAAVEEELPETVEAVVTTRIDRLAPADRTLLRWASVLGHAFPGDLVAAVLAGDPEAAADSEAWDRLAEFVERDPDVPGGFRFRHALIRDAAYEGLSYRRRRELHARVGEVLEQLGDAEPELMSLHFLRAEVHEKAWTYALAAGERAREKFANVEAAGFFRTALEAARRLPQLDARAVALAWESLGDVSQLAGLYADAEHAFRQARRLVEKGGPDEVALLLKEGIIRERSGRYTEALRWYGRGLKAAQALPEGDARAIHEVELGLASAGVRFRQGRFRDCIAWCRRVVDAAGAIAYLPGLAHAYFLLHVSYTELGDADRVAYRGLALPIYEELGDLFGQAQVLNNLGIDAYYEGRWDDALDLYRRSRELRDRIGDVVGAATVANNIGEIKSDQGQLEAAEQLFREVRRVTEAAGNRFLATLAVSNLGRVAARDGRLEEARELLEEALAGFVEIGSAGFVLETELRLAEVELLAGDAEAAFRRAEATLARAGGDAPKGVLSASLHRVRGAALAAAGDRDRAREALEDGLALARGLGADFEAALALAELARLEGSAELAAEATRALRRLGVSTPAALG